MAFCAWATTTAAEPLTATISLSVVLAAETETLEVRWAPATACRAVSAAPEALVTCDRAIEVVDTTGASPTLIQWRAGFDSFLVTSSTELRSEGMGEGRLRFVALREPSVSRSDARSQRRLVLLRAQWWHYNGRPDTAQTLLAALDADDPDNPDVLSFRARIDLERGRSRRAEETFRTALGHSPRRSDLKRAVAELADQRAPAIEVEQSVRRVGGVWTESKVSLVSRRELSPYLALAARLDRIEGQITGLRLRSGEVESPVFQQTLVEGSLDYQLIRGTRLRAGATGGPSGLGVFGGVEFVNAAGRTLIGAERNRPFGEFLEGAAQAGSRDRLEVTRQQTLGARGGAWVVAARNAYRLQGDVMASSLALTLGAVYQVRRRDPSISLQYGFDTEGHIAQTSIELEFGPFAPLAVASRQVHVAGVNVVQGVAGRFRLDVSGGYAVDRLGGQGTFGLARVWTPTAKRVNADMWAEYRLHVLTTAQRATRAGARVWVTF